MFSVPNVLFRFTLLGTLIGNVATRIGPVTVVRSAPALATAQASNAPKSPHDLRANDFKWEQPRTIPLMPFVPAFCWGLGQGHVLKTKNYVLIDVFCLRLVHHVDHGAPIPHTDHKC